MLKRIAVTGGPAATLYEGTLDATDVSWGTNDMIVFALSTDGNPLMQMASTGGVAEPVTTLAEDESDHRQPALLPGGTALLFVVASGNDSTVAVKSLETGERRLLFGGTSPRYVPSGHIIFARENAIWAAPFDADQLSVTGDPVPMLEGVAIGSTGYAQLAVAGNGSLVYVTSGSGSFAPEQQLLVVDLDGNEEALALAPRNIQAVGWSPDGQSVVYSSEAQIYTYNVALGTTPRQLTFEGVNRYPVFSPDGTRVAFESTREGTTGGDLFVKNLDDDSPPTAIVTLDANQWPNQWPSDTLIVFERGAGGVRDLWMVDLSDPDDPRAEAYLSSEADPRRNKISPDGTLAAYTSNESGQYEIYIRSFPEPGERTLVSEGGGLEAWWSPDGNTVYYGSGLEATSMAARIRRDPTPVVLSRDSLFTLSGVSFADLHPDGDRWIIAQAAEYSPDPDEGAAEPQKLILVQNWTEELKRLVPVN